MCASAQFTALRAVRFRAEAVSVIVKVDEGSGGGGDGPSLSFMLDSK